MVRVLHGMGECCPALTRFVQTACLQLQLMATRVRSYSKINLGLAIGPVRTDGFHGLMTLYQTLALHDVVTVTARRVDSGGETRIALTTNHPFVPRDGRNTAWKMVERCLARLGVADPYAREVVGG